MDVPRCCYCLEGACQQGKVNQVSGEVDRMPRRRDPGWAELDGSGEGGHEADSTGDSGMSLQVRSQGSSLNLLTMPETPEWQHGYFLCVCVCVCVCPDTMAWKTTLHPYI